MGAQQRWGRGDAGDKDVGQGFSHCDVHRNLLGVMLKCGFSLSGLGKGLSVYF